MRRETVWAALAIAGCTDRELVALMREHEDVEALWENFGEETLAAVGSRADARRAKVVARKNTLTLDAVAERIAATGASVATADNRSGLPYPEDLGRLANPPAMLWVRGTLPERMIAIVGSRKSTDYSRRVLERIIPPLVTAGYATVSGGAYGVDTLVHAITMDAGGRTVAVVGTGIDGCYPVSNRALYERIVATGGAVVSQFALGAGGEAFRFPIRNETIAALGLGTLVTEAAEASGSLITARLALDLGREVFAVPGDIFRENSAGTNGLIARGEAACVSSAQNILDILASRAALPPRPIVPRTRPTPSVQPTLSFIPAPTFDCSTDEGKILSRLADASLSADDLSDALDMDAAALVCTLAMMELDGVVVRTNTGAYRRAG